MSTDCKKLKKKLKDILYIALILLKMIGDLFTKSHTNILKLNFEICLPRMYNLNEGLNFHTCYNHTYFFSTYYNNNSPYFSDKFLLKF